MSEPTDSADEESPEETTPRGARKPPGLDGRGGDVDDESEMPPEALEDVADRYEDKYEAAREIANPDQHRDDEPYD